MGNDDKKKNKKQKKKKRYLCRCLCHEHVCKVSASSPLRFLRRRFLNIFRKFTLYVAMATNQIQRF